ncbi:MAG: hypothetical protein JRJ65_19700, partial [Deltaproteobacteria bacterium]|nr:hypothetical protein [Deltaproteobacteria bacterium]
MNIENKQSSPLVIASILIVAVLIYIKGVFRIFHNWDELISVIPAYLTTGICLGLFFSLLPLKRPMRSAFFCAAAVPLVSSLIYRSISIVMALDGVGGGDGSFSLPFWGMVVWVTITSIMYGFVAMFGCYLGLEITRRTSRFYLSFKNGSDDVSQGSELKAAKIGAATTIVVSLLSALVSIF